MPINRLTHSQSPSLKFRLQAMLFTLVHQRSGPARKYQQSIRDIRIAHDHLNPTVLKPSNRAFTTREAAYHVARAQSS